VRFVPQVRRGRIYTVTDAQRPKSEDIAYRQRRYLISMGVRVVAFLLAVFLFHGIWRFIGAAVALVIPYFAVVFANGGREPNNAAEFDSSEPENLPGHRAPVPGSSGQDSAEPTDSEPRVAADRRSSTPGSPGPGNTRHAG
jgi:Protein of unknown function (DUF3099)